MARRKPQPSGQKIVLERDLIKSSAFLELMKRMPIAVYVYLQFRLRIKVAKTKNGPWVQCNRGEIIFTYDEAEKKMGITRPRFQRCLDALIELGFIDIAHHGEGLRGDCSKYDISERWRDYGKPEFKEKPRPKGTRGYGFALKNKGDRLEESNTDVTWSSNTGVTYGASN